MQSAHLGFPIRFPMNFHDVVKFLPDRVQLGTNEISDFWAKCLVIDFHFDFLGLKIELSQKIGMHLHVLRLLEFTVSPKFGGNFFLPFFKLKFPSSKGKLIQSPSNFLLVCCLVISLKKCRRSKFSSHQRTGKPKAFFTFKAILTNLSGKFK